MSDADLPCMCGPNGCECDAPRSADLSAVAQAATPDGADHAAEMLTAYEWWQDLRSQQDRKLREGGPA